MSLVSIDATICSAAGIGWFSLDQDPFSSVGAHFTLAEFWGLERPGSFVD
jgi:hypothetical protein